MSAYWQNNTCNPFKQVNATCTLGNMAPYAVTVEDWSDIAATFDFAREQNIRVTVKNTGHDYLGRSSGEGSLALWMHRLHEMSWLNYTSATYSGPALRAAAGVQFAQVYEEASSRGLRVVGGLCPSVGLAGAYVQGGGHGPLSATYGLAADNVLEFEVVTTGGEHLVASPTQHRDLYWALSGGGDGTYGVVISVTVKAHPDGIVAGCSLTLNAPDLDPEAFWSAVSLWYKHVLVLNEVQGLSVNWGVSAAQLTVRQAALTGGTATDIAGIMAPFIQELKSAGLQYIFETTEHRGFYEYYKHYNAAEYPTNATVGSRLIQRSTVQDDSRLQDFIAVVRSIAGQKNLAVQVNGQAANVSHSRAGNTPGSNAVLPAWRDSLFHMIIAVSFNAAASNEELQYIQERLNNWQDQVKGVDPDNSGAYMNEATYDNPDWKKDYYGANYGALLVIKEKYDPRYVLWSRPSVGSDISRSMAQDGRLCPVNQ
jgi:FAD/FMN-containing dehydrogenase